MAARSCHLATVAAAITVISLTACTVNNPAPPPAVVVQPQSPPSVVVQPQSPPPVVVQPPRAPVVVQPAY